MWVRQVCPKVPALDHPKKRYDEKKQLHFPTQDPAIPDNFKLVKLYFPKQKESKNGIGMSSQI